MLLDNIFSRVKSSNNCFEIIAIKLNHFQMCSDQLVLFFCLFQYMVQIRRCEITILNVQILLSDNIYNFIAIKFVIEKWFW